MPIIKYGLWSNRVYLTEEEREKLIDIVEEESGFRPETVFTYDELVDYFEDLLISEGVSENLLYYIDVDMMIEDELQSGYLSSLVIELDGTEIEIFFFY